MPNVVCTDKGRVLDLPLSIKDVMTGETIISTNAPGGRLFVDDDEKGNAQLNDASLLEKEDADLQYISLPLIEDQQLDKEIDLASKLMQIREIERKQE